MRARIQLTLLVAATLLTASVAADPLPGGDLLKFQQVPMDGTLIDDVRYFGHDELSTATSTFDVDGNLLGYAGQFMADDFADSFDDPVVHVRWWGSYLDNEIIQPVDKFLIAFEADIPAGVGGVPHSRPGQVLHTQIVTRGPLAPGSGTFTEKTISPGGPPLGEVLYEYNAELHVGKEFPQQADVIYWLKIVALIDAPAGTDQFTRWGWHNRDYTLMDPLASPVPVPGERIVGTIGLSETPVWQFQDNAVSGPVLVGVDPIMPEVIQDGPFNPQHYLDGIDGPQGISEFSKDLAFELFTVPEPVSAMAWMLGGLALLRRRR
jgi:hypothetical protein